MPNQFFGRVKAIDHDGLIMVRLGSKRADGGAQIRKVIDQTEAVDLQATGTAVLGLQEDRRGKFAGDRRLADTFRTVDQDPRRQLCGELANIGEVHLTSSLSFLAEDEIERDAERTARLAVGIATERAANGFGVSAVLNRDRERDGAVTRGSVGVRTCLVVGQEDLGEAAVREPADSACESQPAGLQLEALGCASVGKALAAHGALPQACRSRQPALHLAGDAHHG